MCPESTAAAATPALHAAQHPAEAARPLESLALAIELEEDMRLKALQPIQRMLEMSR